MDTVKKKLRETRFYLRQLLEQRQLAFSDPEEFDFCLSAFLCAARSIDYRLRHLYKAKYKTFYTKWERTLQPPERGLLKLMVDDRNLEVHEAGSSRLKQEERIPVSQRYQDKSGTMTVTGPRGAPPAQIVKPVYAFHIDGQLVPVDECCGKYLELLEQLVADFSRHA
ncbi:MAG: hypothetical protein E6K58_10925 [Nitrospirae bacterium]|nr:MAG: hypothetical protein E6K58_10925 [Nitrospirota bacterium]